MDEIFILFHLHCKVGRSLLLQLYYKGVLLNCTQDSIQVNSSISRVGGGGGGGPLYQVYRYVPPQRVWFLSRFGLKTGIDFEHVGLKLGMFISNWGE